MMNKQLRELARRIEFIEDFPVQLRIKHGMKCPEKIQPYGFQRAASRKWSIDYWLEKRNIWPFLEIQIPSIDGGYYEGDTPLFSPRFNAKNKRGYAGDIIEYEFRCKGEDSAKSLLADLRNLNINAKYNYYKTLLFFHSYIVSWTSPPLHMNGIEAYVFDQTFKEITKKYDAYLHPVVGNEYVSLDDCPSDYKYISSISDIKWSKSRTCIY